MQKQTKAKKKKEVIEIIPDEITEEKIPTTSVTVIPEKSKTPTELIDMEKHVASVCKEIVTRTACNIQGKKYIQVAGWQSIATAHGYVLSSKDVKRVYDDHSGEFLGWSATGYATDSKGVVRAEGNGFVGIDEGPTKEYAGRAKAQTRSMSRCARGMFSQIVVMMDANLEQTPAEEVPAGGFNQQPKQPAPNKPRSPSKADWIKKVSGLYATAEKKKLIPAKDLDKYQTFISNIKDESIQKIKGFDTALRKLVFPE